jgi:uncharacterized membrane protein YebE (DUF533 family)
MDEKLKNRIAATRGNLWLLKEDYDISKEIPLGMDYDCYFKSMLLCAAGDGEIAKEERDWILGYAEALGAPPSTLKELETYTPTVDTDVKSILSESEAAYMTRRFCIYYAVAACNADGAYKDGERKAIRKLATALEISEDRVRQIEDMYEDAKKLRRKRLDILYPEGPPY